MKERDPNKIKFQKFLFKNRFYYKNQSNLSKQIGKI